MKKRIFIILIIFMIILAVVAYGVYNYRKQVIESQEINNTYKSYESVQLLGTELISIINQTIDIDERLGIEKDENGLYIDNGRNSIKMYIELSYGEDETRTIEAEKIANSGIDSFMEIYSTASFHCTNITYHQETNNIQSITFSQVTN